MSLESDLQDRILALESVLVTLYLICDDNAVFDARIDSALEQAREVLCNTAAR